MQSSNLPKVTEPVHEPESRVHALNYLAMLLEDTRWHQENEKEPDMTKRLGEGEILQAEGNSKHRGFQSGGRTWLFQRKEATVAEQQWTMGQCGRRLDLGGTTGPTK